MFSLLYASDAPWNESQFKNPKFDQMLLQARGELDFAKRKAIYDDMQGDGRERGRHGDPGLYLQRRRARPRRSAASCRTRSAA